MKKTPGQLDPTTHQFITKTFGTNDVQIMQLAGDASSRRYARVIHNDNSYVLMIWEPFVDDGRYPFLNILNHFAKHEVQVPEVISKAPNLGLVLLEDLGDLTLERKFWENQQQSLVVPHYKMAIDELLKIHYPATEDSSPGCIAHTVSFNVEKLLWEMNYGLEHLVEKFCHIKIPDDVREEITALFVDICTTLHEEPKRICHRDYHSRNIMLTMGKTRIIDFQDARMGPVQYDLVSLLHDSYVDMDDETRQELLEYYILKSKDFGGAPVNRDQFHSIFRLQMIQRCFKAAGSFSSFYNMREDTRYLKYLKPTVAKVVMTLDQYPAYSTFTNLLRDNGLLEIDYLNPTEI
ncbi:MAG: phosphotransferase [Bdellovibrionales bacterium]|nr:phosphotransferase [Bdellovibrionales bacterium]